MTGIEDEEVRSAWEYYVNQIYEVDQFIGDLVQALEDRKEPTVLVLYGDHLPTLGLKSEDLKGRYLYNTNYVVWDNIGLEKQDRNIASYQIMADVLRSWIFIPEQYSIITRREGRRRTTYSIWRCCSMIFSMERSMCTEGKIQCRKDTCRWELRMSC